MSGTTVTSTWRMDLASDRMNLLEWVWSQLTEDQKMEFLRKELQGPFKVQLSGVMQKGRT